MTERNAEAELNGNAAASVTAGNWWGKVKVNGMTEPAEEWSWP